MLWEEIHQQRHTWTPWIKSPRSQLNYRAASLANQTKFTLASSVIVQVIVFAQRTLQLWLSRTSKITARSESAVVDQKQLHSIFFSFNLIWRFWNKMSQKCFFYWNKICTNVFYQSTTSNNPAWNIRAYLVLFALDTAFSSLN